MDIDQNENTIIEKAGNKEKTIRPAGVLRRSKAPGETDEMKVTMRLYRSHDLDLMALYYNPDFKFTAAVRTALRSYLRGDMRRIEQPEPHIVPPAPKSDASFRSKKFPPYKVQFHVTLRRRAAEGDVIDWACNINPGYRNSLFKNILRMYLSGISLEFYTQDDDVAERASELNKLQEENCAAGTIQMIKGTKNKQGEKAQKDGTVQEATVKTAQKDDDGAGTKGAKETKGIKGAEQDATHDGLPHDGQSHPENAEKGIVEDTASTGHRPAGPVQGTGRRAIEGTESDNEQQAHKEELENGTDDMGDLTDDAFDNIMDAFM